MIDFSRPVTHGELLLLIALYFIVRPILWGFVKGFFQAAWSDFKKHVNSGSS